MLRLLIAPHVLIEQQLAPPIEDSLSSNFNHFYERARGECQSWRPRLLLERNTTRLKSAPTRYAAQNALRARRLHYRL